MLCFFLGYLCSVFDEEVYILCVVFWCVWCFDLFRGMCILIEKGFVLEDGEEINMEFMFNKIGKIGKDLINCIYIGIGILGKVLEWILLDDNGILRI